VRTNQKQKPKVQVAVKQQIAELFALADDVFVENPERASRYVDLARKLGMKHKIRLLSSQQRRFCKHCYCYISSGVNGRIRTRDGKLVMTCFACKKHTRFGYSKERKAQKA